MKQLQAVLFLMMIGVAFASQALDQDVQVDLLVAKIIKADKEGRAADVLPAAAKLESMEPSLSKPLPESFHYIFIDNLDKAGDHANALRRANIYMEKFGKRGKHYSMVLEIMSRLEEEADKNAKAAEAKAKAREQFGKCSAAKESNLTVLNDRLNYWNSKLEEDSDSIYETRRSRDRNMINVTSNQIKQIKSFDCDLPDAYSSYGRYFSSVLQ